MLIVLLEVGVAYRAGLHKRLANVGAGIKNGIYRVRNLITFLMKTAIETSAYKY
jgi:hypothetical protein